ncbi:MAG: DUF6728 family protein [Flavobacteriales bacterium]
MKPLLKKILGYLDLRNLFRKDKEDKGLNIRFMHGINRISILLFLICLMVMLFRAVF